ncbi:hypothetical protein KQR76_000632 [Citrobacter freundii]|nr:hypothetical protein [Citrobacter freundii]
MNPIRNILGEKCTRLYEIGYYLISAREPDEVSCYKRNELICLFKEIDKDIECFRNNYIAPLVMVVTPCDGFGTEFYVGSCWSGCYKSYIPSPCCCEDLLAADKEAYLSSVGNIQKEANYMKNLLIEKGFLTEEDFL